MIIVQSPNIAINTDSQEQCSFVALLLAAGYGGRSACRDRSMVRAMEHEIQRLDVEHYQALSACFGVFIFLRPHLSEARFVEQVRVQATEGYKIAYIQRGGEVVAAAGYRVATFLAWGRVLYIDDLITHPERKRAGLGGALIDWLLAEGKRLGCDEVHLDTGHQRHDAHRLYLNKGFALSGHHMSVKLT